MSYRGRASAEPGEEAGDEDNVKEGQHRPRDGHRAPAHRRRELARVSRMGAREIGTEARMTFEN